MSALVPLMTSTAPLLDRASAGVRALMNAMNRTEGEYFEEGHFNAAQVKKELQEANVEAKVRGLKRLLAAHASGLDVSGLLPEVVKAIAVPALELKRLVYLFLILHAETSRDVALLSINSFQKDLADRNQIVRATALRALASIRLLEVVQLLMAALRRAAADSSPFVRRTAAQCIMKVFTLDPDQFQELQKIVLTLLKDVEISVVGAALVAFRELCVRHGAADCLSCQGAQLTPQQLHVHGHHHMQREEYEGDSENLLLQQQVHQQQQQPWIREVHQPWVGEVQHSRVSQTRARSFREAFDEESMRQQKLEEERGKRKEEKKTLARAHRQADPQLGGTWNAGDGCELGTGRSEGGRQAAAAACDAAAASSDTVWHNETGGSPPQAVVAAAAARNLRSSSAQACALALLHKHYRRLQEAMVNLEPHAQVVAVDLFLRYTRLFFAKPAALFRQVVQQQEEQQVQQQQQRKEQGKRRGQGEESGGCARSSSFSSFASRQRRSDSDSRAAPSGGSLTFEKLVEKSASNPLPADLKLFLRNLHQLLYSESAAVIAAVAAAFYHLLPTTAWKPLVHPLLRCMYTSSVEFQEPLLHIAAVLAAAAPSLFLPHFRSFFVAFGDPSCVRQGKLLVLRRLLFSSRFPLAAAAAPEEAATLPSLLLQELCTYIRWPGDPLLLSTCFNFLVSIALRFHSAQSACMQIFVQLLDAPASCTLASEAITALQVLLQQQQEQLQQQQQAEDEEDQVCGAAGAAVVIVESGSAEDWTGKKKSSFRLAEAKKKQAGGREQLGWLVLQLAVHLSRVRQGPAARASVVWIVGEYQREVGWVAADVFRQLAASFKQETEEVKLQILLLGLKVWALHWGNKQLLKQQEQQQHNHLLQQVGKRADLAAAADSFKAGRESQGSMKPEVRDEEGEASMPLCNGASFAAAQERHIPVAAQERRQTTSPYAKAEGVKEEERSAGFEAWQQRQKQQCEEQQRYLLPLPTPEESAVAFPRIDKILKFVCEAASFDISYDVRDMARLYFALSRLALAGRKDDLHEGGAKTSDSNMSSSSSMISNHSRNTGTHENSSTSAASAAVKWNSTSSESKSNRSNSTSPPTRVNVFGEVKGGGGASAAVTTRVKENDAALALEGLAGCGGQMRAGASPQTLADMIHFSRRYMRMLVRGSTKKLRSNPRLHRRTTPLQLTAAGCATAVAAAAPAPFDSDARPHRSTDDSSSERKNIHVRDLRSANASSNSSSSESAGARNNTCTFAEGAHLYRRRLKEEASDLREDQTGECSALLLGSLSEFLGERMRGYTDLPPFASVNSSDDLRKNESPAAILPELTQSLVRGGSALAYGEQSSSNLSSSRSYIDVQEVKAISSDDIIVKRSAAALMGRDTNAKAALTPLDLDSFYAAVEPNAGDAAAAVSFAGVQPVSTAFTAAAPPASISAGAAAAAAGTANNACELFENTFLSCTSVTACGNIATAQQRQQQSVWDMLGEAHAPHLRAGESTSQELHQTNTGHNLPQYQVVEGASAFTSLHRTSVVDSRNPVETEDHGGKRGVAVAGEDEESDEERSFPATNR